MELAFGLQKSTLLDYPGKISGVVFFYGCNFRCPFCHNPELVVLPKNEKMYKEGEILEFLKFRRDILDGVVFSGGEPLLFESSYSLIKTAKDLGYSVKVDTNGSFPERLQKLVDDELVDYVAMDIKNSEEKYPITCANKMLSMENIRKSIKIIMDSGLDYEFRTTVVPGLHDMKSIAGIGILIKGAKRHFIQNFRNGKVLNKDFENVNGFKTSELIEFKSVLLQYVSEVSIRG